MTPKPIAVGGTVTASFLNDLVGVYDRSTATVDVVSTLVATTIYTKVIAAGAMSSDRMLRCTIIGDYLQSTGVDNRVNLRVSLGGVLLMGEAGINTTTAATRHPWQMNILIANLGLANSQYAAATVAIGGSTAGSAAGIGGWDRAMATATLADTSTAGIMGVSGSTAVDTALAQTLLITAQPSVSSASLSWRKRYAILELL